MNKPSNALAISRPFLLGLQWLNGLYALGVGVMLVFSLAFPDFLHRVLGVEEGAGRELLVAGLRAVVILGLVAAGIVHLVLRHLRAIVETVHQGDPFVVDNARRLQAIAWLVFAGEMLRLAIAAVVWWVAKAPQPLKIDVDMGFSLAPWLAVLLLFVLARVFAEGARMRADLEGTV
jgi:hypothetical protein